MLRLLSKYGGEDLGGVDVEVTWAPVLPRDTSAAASCEEKLVQSGIHSRHRAMAELGVADAEGEFARWLAERSAILRMNRELNVKGAV